MVCFLESTSSHQAWADDTKVFTGASFDVSGIQFGFTADEIEFSGQPGPGPIDFGFTHDMDSDNFTFGDPMDDNNDDRPNQQSKLQASLKPYERRNKKKRPPNYYQKDRGGDGFSFQGPVMHHNYTVPPPGHPAHYDGTNITYPNMHMHTYMNNPQIVANTGYANPTVLHQGQMNTPDSGMSQQNHGRPPPQGVMPHPGDDLVEVVVHGFPENSIHIPARTETNLIQDHERTSNSRVNVDQYASDPAISPKIQHQPIQSQNISYPQGQSVQGAKSNHVHVSVKEIPKVENNSSSHKPSSENVTNNNTVSNTNSGDGGQNVKVKSQVNVDSVPSNAQTSARNPTEDSASVNAKESASVKVSEEVVKEAPKPPKPVSWAGLFKSASSTSATPQQSSQAPLTVAHTSKGDESTDMEKSDAPVMPVLAAEDSVAKELGGIL